MSASPLSTPNLNDFFTLKKVQFDKGSKSSVITSILEEREALETAISNKIDLILRQLASSIDNPSIQTINALEDTLDWFRRAQKPGVDIRLDHNTIAITGVIDLNNPPERGQSADDMIMGGIATIFWSVLAALAFIPKLAYGFANKGDDRYWFKHTFDHEDHVIRQDLFGADHRVTLELDETVRLLVKSSDTLHRAISQPAEKPKEDFNAESAHKPEGPHVGEKKPQ